MDKLDFDILLSKISSTNGLQDVALVSGLASATQQIKNIVHLNQSDKPFNPSVAANLQSIFLQNFTNIVAIDRINSVISNAIPNVFNVGSSIQVINNIPNVKVTFGYRSLTSTSVNNQITIKLDSII